MDQRSELQRTEGNQRMDETFEGTTMRIARSSLTITVPPEQVADLQKLFTLESLGFLPPHALKYSPAEQAFTLDLSGKAVSHLIELLEIAVDDRKAETWSEREARADDQYSLFV